VGDFDFSGYRSLANMVYVRDLDLYRISVDWSFLLLFGMFFLVWGAKAVALRNSTALPPAR
jgi:ABC-type multidrug transport system permease subunit